MNLIQVRGYDGEVVVRIKDYDGVIDFLSLVPSSWSKPESKNETKQKRSEATV